MKNRFWKDAWDYLVECKYHILLSLGIFVFGSIVGFSSPGSFSFFNDLLRDIVSKTDGLGFFGLLLYILSNNVTSAFTGLVFGFLLGIIPIFNSLLNGVLLGYVFARAYDAGGIGVIWHIVPHGIFELPAIFIALGLGMHGGLFVFQKNKKLAFTSRFSRGMRAFFAFVVPLLVVAAIIESLLIVYW